MPLIRPATESDLPAILSITNREIREGIAHFGTEELTLDQALTDFRNNTDRHPILIAQLNGTIVGFAKSSPWKPRGAYKHTAEITVYIEPAYQRRGIARALYKELITQLKALNYHTLLAGIALPNPASIALHESIGMHHAGTLPQVGQKQNQWIDVAYYALTLPDATAL